MWNIVDILLILSALIVVVDLAVRKVWNLIPIALLLTDIAALIWRHPLNWG